MHDRREVEQTEFEIGHARRDGLEANALAPLLSYFPPGRLALGSGPWPSSATRARLEALGVRCPAIDDAQIATYLAWLREHAP